MRSAFAATARTPSPMSTPAAFASAQRAASMSWPITRHPAAARFLAIAPPMMPRPMMPTVLALSLMLSPNRVVVVVFERGRYQRELLMQIGIAGLGRMGAAMAARLMEVGHTLAVWNRTPEKAKPLTDAGARLAATPEDLAEHSDAVITMLTDADAIDHVYNGENGLLSADVTDTLFIEMSTVRPEVSIALAKVVRASGARFVECPVGGTTGPARQGKLFGFMGADEGDAELAEPILNQLCR